MGFEHARGLDGAREPQRRRHESRLCSAFVAQHHDDYHPARRGSQAIPRQPDVQLHGAADWGYHDNDDNRRQRRYAVREDDEYARVPCRVAAAGYPCSSAAGCGWCCREPGAADGERGAVGDHQ